MDEELPTDEIAPQASAPTAAEKRKPASTESKRQEDSMNLHSVMTKLDAIERTIAEQGNRQAPGADLASEKAQRQTMQLLTQNKATIEDLVAAVKVLIDRVTKQAQGTVTKKALGDLSKASASAAQAAAAVEKATQALPELTKTVAAIEKSVTSLTKSVGTLEKRIQKNLTVLESSEKKFRTVVLALDRKTDDILTVTQRKFESMEELKKSIETLIKKKK